MNGGNLGWPSLQTVQKQK